MLGWIVFFALMTVIGMFVTAAELPAPATASVITSLVFSVLLVVSLLCRLIRDRA
jgi:hypothetical protein